MTAKIFLQHQYSAQTRESDTFPCHNSNHQNSKTEPSDMTQNKENFYGFMLQLTSKKECYRYSELISALNTFNCSFHAEAQATPNVQNIICERKKFTFIQLPFVFPKLNQPCVCKKEIPCFGERI